LSPGRREEEFPSCRRGSEGREGESTPVWERRGERGKEKFSYYAARKGTEQLLLNCSGVEEKKGDQKVLL